MELDLDGSAGYEIKTGYTYDQLNRLTDLVQQKTGAVSLATYNYTLRANGHRHSLSETLSESRNITYTYDNLNRLTDETADSGDDGYDAHYTYDLAGNRTQRVVSVNGQELITDYTYDPNTDRLVKETHAGPVYSYVSGNERYYAYAGSGKSFYYRDLRGNKVGSLSAFMRGLPSVWSRYLFVLAMALVPVLLFGPALVKVILRLVFCYGAPTRLRPRVPRKGICLLVAFVMLFGPEGLHQLAEADVQYANLSTATWAQGDRDIHYAYDDNGSVIEKITANKDEPDPQKNFEEKITYTYNLQNRLAQIVREYDDSGDKIEEFTEYKYNADGIKVSKHTWSEINDTHQNDDVTVVYLTDSYNRTGYAQTLEELTFNKANPDPLTETPDSLRAYLIGDDVIAQTEDGSTQYLLYDGHGSTRQLAEYDGSVTIADSYSYDGYGVLLQDDSVASSHPGKVDTQATNLLYCGEHLDIDAQQYYFRARWYNALTGLFNRVDPYSGNISDPKSLHEYLYAHCNPVNNTDPAGLSILSVAIRMSVVSSLMAAIFPHAMRVFLAAKQMLALTGLTNLVRSLANRGVIELEVAESIRAEAFYTFADLLATLGKSLLLIAKEIALYYGYSMAFAAVTRIAMGGMKTSVRLTKIGLAKLKFGNVLIDRHHTVFKCAVKGGVRQRLFYLPKYLRKGAGTGLHSRIARHPIFYKLQPKKGVSIEQVIRNAGGPQKWLNKLGKCYKWLETQNSAYKGIYEAYKKAVVDIGGVEGIIDVGT